MSSKELSTKKKDELVSMCKERKLPYSGTKPVLIARLLGEPAPAPKVSKQKEAAVAAGVREKTISAPPACFRVVSKLYIHARKNAYGNFQDPDSALVFDPETRHVIGKQVGAEVEKLSIDDVKYCRERGLVFSPQRFDGNFSSTTEDIEVLIEKLLKEGADISDDEDEAEDDD